MKPYHKIESAFVRDDKTHKLIDGAWRLPEFEYLKDLEWTWEEKVDGTNVRVMWDGSIVRFGGRTDNAQIYVPLLDNLTAMFPAQKMFEVFPGDVVDGNPVAPEVCLYGEGYGARIQKGGGNYRPDVSFVLFDVKVGPWWLKREDVLDVSKRLGIDMVPVLDTGTLVDAVVCVRSGRVKSLWGDFFAEGLVCRPAVDLAARNGDRIITKVKARDF